MGFGIASYWFDLVSTTYTPRNFDKSKLVIVGADLVFTDTSGNRISFDGLCHSVVNRRGLFKSWEDPFGNKAIVPQGSGADSGYTANGQIKWIDRYNSTTAERYEYAYSNDQISTVSLKQSASTYNSASPGSGSISWSTIRTVEYEYYGSGSSNGLPGDLKRVQVKSGTDVIDSRYYRYYTTNGSPAFASGLKMAFNPESYSRALASVGGTFSNLESASDASIDQFATHQLEYSGKQISKHVVQGAAGASDDGLGTYDYDYLYHQTTSDLNDWTRRTTVTDPTGSTTTTYINTLGQPVLEIFENTTAGKWGVAYHYDTAGRLVWRAHPSAVSFTDNSGYGVVYDLAVETFDDVAYVNNSTGLVDVYNYYGDGSDHTGTAASESTAGAVSGYLEDTLVNRGLSGTAQLIERKAYKATPSSTISEPIYPIGKLSRFRGAGATGEEYFEYTYSWHLISSQATTAIKDRKTILPAITTGKNGSNSSNFYLDRFDEWGRTAWHQDEAGKYTRYQYETLTGALTTLSEDADKDSLTGPTGGDWITTADGLNAITSIGVDALGRTISVTAPNGNITRTVFLDAAHEVRVYEGWHASGMTYAATGPTTVIKRNQDTASGSIFYEVLTMTATPGVSGSNPTGGESISGLLTLSRSITNEAAQITSDENYYNLSGVTYNGSDLTLVDPQDEVDHFYRKTYAYDSTGQVTRYVGPTDTIYRTLRDDLGRTVSTWVGLDDNDGAWDDPGDAGDDLAQSAAYEYDGGGVGDSNLTKAINYPNSSGGRWTQYFHDWRNRLTATKLGGTSSPGGEDQKVQRQVMYYTRDNLGQITQVDTYDGDEVSISYSSGVPSAPDADAIRSRVAMAYDELGRAYQTSVYNVTYTLDGNADPDTATVGSGSNALDTGYWYDSRGNLIKTSNSGGLIIKSTYDGLNRLSIQYASDGGSDSGYGDADDVSGDKVLAQLESTYDLSGNTLMLLSRQRFHDETDTGALEEESGSSTVKARVSYHTFYYDLADRLVKDVDVGTNAGSSYTRPGSAPSSSDTALVVGYSYVDPSTSKDVGWLMSVTSARGTETRYSYDALGRMTQQIEGYDSPGTPTASTNRNTGYVYDGNDNVTLQTVYLPSSAYQQTRYIYEQRDTLIGFNSNDLLSAVRYAVSGGGADTVGGTQEETYNHNILGEVIKYTDRNNSTHEYEYDALGRLGSDEVTTYGSGVDQFIDRITYSLNSASQLNSVNSRDTSLGDTDSNIINQVKFEYNGFGQLTKDIQEHGGSVDGDSAVVQYVYDETPSGANYSRLKEMIYPDGFKIYYTYSGLDSSISRTSSVKHDLHDTVMGTHTPDFDYEAYSYLGLSTVVELDRPNALTRMTYIAQGAEGTGDAGDIYRGLDRFGRLVDQRWRETDGTHSDIDRFKYGYDRDGNALYKTTELNHAFDELYKANDSLVGSNDSYDKLGRTTAYGRGTVNTSLLTQSTTTRNQSWTYDALGNWSSNILDTNGSTSGGSTTTTRTHNERNQITSTNYSHDNNGNMLTYPNGVYVDTHTYDAWDRMASFVTGNGALPDATYQYDGLGRRILSISGNAYNHRYYSKDWQLILEQTLDEEESEFMLSQLNSEELEGLSEEDEALIQAMRADATFGKLEFDFGQSESSEFEEQELELESFTEVEDGNPQGFVTVGYRDRMAYVWSEVYVDAMIARERDGNGNGTYTDPYEADFRNYTHWDANFNVTSLSAVSDTDYDGTMDDASPMAQRMAYDPYGTVQFPNQITWTIGSNSYNWAFLHQGGKREGTNLYTFRNRDYNATLGRFIQQDPLGYVDGSNLYQSYRSSPVNFVDPAGLSPLGGSAAAAPILTLEKAITAIETAVAIGNFSQALSTAHDTKQSMLGLGAWNQEEANAWMRDQEAQIAAAQAAHNAAMQSDSSNSEKESEKAGEDAATDAQPAKNLLPEEDPDEEFKRKREEELAKEGRRERVKEILFMYVIPIALLTSVIQCVNGTLAAHIKIFVGWIEDLFDSLTSVTSQNTASDESPPADQNDKEGGKGLTDEEVREIKRNSSIILW